MKIRILPRALSDLAAGRDFYENQGEGLGAYFLDSLYSDIDSLVFMAGMHPARFGGFFQMLSRRFPYAVYYKMNGHDEVVVRAVLDCRRNPSWTMRRLGRPKKTK